MLKFFNRLIHTLGVHTYGASKSHIGMFETIIWKDCVICGVTKIDYRG